MPAGPTAFGIDFDVDGHPLKPTRTGWTRTRLSLMGTAVATLIEGNAVA